MSIAHELSCDVATAMLTERAGERREAAADDLTDIVLEVHTTLRRLTNEERRRRRAHARDARTSQTNAASGRH